MIEPAVVSLTAAGVRLSRLLADSMRVGVRHVPGGDGLSGGEVAYSGGVGEIIRRVWSGGSPMIMIMAVGIAVRIVGPLAKDKRSDPAVVVVDEAGRHAVSLLSGHEGGANKLALQTAAAIGACPVISTASESGRDLVIGVGSRREVLGEQLKTAFELFIKENELDPGAVMCLATGTVKQGRPYMEDLAESVGRPMIYVPMRRIKAIGSLGGTGSSAARRNLGVDGVSEQAAMLVTPSSRLAVGRQAFDGVTLAAARVGGLPS